MAQPKLDGMRCWVDWHDGEPLLWSSVGNLITGVPHINVLLKDWAAKVGYLNFDGELYNPDIYFEEIISIAKRSANHIHEHFTDVQYHIFDIKDSAPNAIRQRKLNDAFDKMPEEVDSQGIIFPVETTSIKRHEIDTQLEIYMSQGYEGIILRNPLAPYVEKRPYTILKWKPSKHDTYMIVRAYEAVSEKGYPLGRLGSLVCSDHCGNIFSVGPGLGIDHKKAEELWKLRDGLPGLYAKVYYQNLTKNGVPRFGKFSLIVDATDVNDEVHV